MVVARGKHIKKGGKKPAERSWCKKEGVNRVLSHGGKTKEKIRKGVEDRYGPFAEKKREKVTLVVETVWSRDTWEKLCGAGRKKRSPLKRCNILGMAGCSPPSEYRRQGKKMNALQLQWRQGKE